MCCSFPISTDAMMITESTLLEVFFFLFYFLFDCTIWECFVIHMNIVSMCIYFNKSHCAL